MDSRQAPTPGRVFAYLRTRPGWSSTTALALTAGTAIVFQWLYTMYSTLFGQAETFSHASTFYLVSLVLVFLLKPVGRAGWEAPLNRWFAVDLLLTTMTAGVFLYIRWDIDALLMRSGGLASGMDRIVAVALVVLTLEATRRTVGLGLALLASAFFFYGSVSHLLPGPLKVAPVPIARMLDVMLFETSGIFGLPVAVVSTYVVIFLILGATLFSSGIGDLLADLSFALTGRARGGPAKAAVIGSTLFGMVTGSASANVSVTGTFTIPLMKQIGYRPAVAGAIETCASVGSLVMPPVMGAGAFVMAAFMGSSYWDVALMAAVPALLYYVYVFACVHFEALRYGIQRWDGETPTIGSVLRRRGHLLIPLAVILAALVTGVSAAQAAMWSTVSTLAVSYLRPETRIGAWTLLDAMESAIRNGLTIFVACGAAGMIIGAVNMSGLGLRFSELIMQISGGYLLTGALLAALTGLVLGLGLTPTVVYITMYALVVPALVKLGAPEAGAHMMAFYYGMLGELTPPVAISAFTAAAIAQANPMATSWQATRIGLAAYLLPLVFVYTPEVLLIGAPGEIVLSLAFVVIGLLCFAAAGAGAMLRPVGWIERGALLVAGACLALPGVATGIAGAVLLAVVVAVQLIWPTKPISDVLFETKEGQP